MPSSYDFNKKDSPPDTEVGGSSRYKTTTTTTPSSESKNNSQLPKKMNNTQKNGSDADAKWRSNYVPAFLDGEEFFKSKSADNRRNMNIASNSHQYDDKLDAKWRANYVASPVDFENVDIQEGHTVIPSSTLSTKSKDGSRQQWGSYSEFLFASLGLTIGIGNVVRFPALVFKCGGGAFLFPYVFFMLLVGLPLYFLELGLGQYSQLGPLNVWRCASVMHGIGIAMVVVSLITAIYYSQMMTYSLYYVFSSFAYIGHELPWSTCGHMWSSQDCLSTRSSNGTNVTGFQQSSAYQFFHNRVLSTPTDTPLSDGIGDIRWDLALILLLSWICVCLVLFKGVRSTGKVARIVTPLSIVTLLIVMICGVTMDGAAEGLEFLFWPRWDELGDMFVWEKALEQVIFSLSVSYGGVIMYGSYCGFRQKAHVSAVVVVFSNFVVSMISCIGVFSTLGAMAYTLNIPIDDIPDLAQSMIFMTIPSAMSIGLPAPHLFVILFFATVYLMGLTSLVGQMHCLIGALQDTIPSLRNSSLPISVVLCSVCYLLGLPLCAEERGFYLFTILSSYGLGISVLIIAFTELMTLSWLYGVRRLCGDFSFMLGYTPGMFWKVSWAFVAPVITLAIIIGSIVSWSDPELKLYNEPSWGPGLRWGLTFVSIGFIPLVFLLMSSKRLCCRQKDRLLGPALSWGPGDSIARSELIAARNASSEAGIDNPALNVNN